MRKASVPRSSSVATSGLAGALACIASLSFAPSAHADFRVFEANAPARPSTPTPATPTPAAPEPTTPEPTTPATTGAPTDGAETDGTTAEGAATTSAETTSAETTSLESGETIPAPAAAPAAAPQAPTPRAENSLGAALERSFATDHRWLDLTGFLQPGYIARFENSADGISSGVVDDTFWLQRARLGVRAQLFSWLRARVELEMTPTAVLQDAYVDIAPHQAFNVRAGQFIVPFLRTFSFNEVNLGFLDRALYTPQTYDRSYIRYLAPRDIGAMAYGSFGDRNPERTDPVFEYQLAMMLGRGPNLPLNEDGVFLFAARLQLHVLGVPLGVDAESDIARNPTPRVAVAASVYSNCDDRGNWNRGFSVDSEFRYEGLYASAAFVWFRNSASDRNFLANSDRCLGETGVTEGSTLDFVSRGAHAQAQWVLPRFWRSLGFPFDGMDLELLGRFDWVDANSPYDASNPLFGNGPASQYVAPTNYTDSDNPPSRYRITLGINYFPTGTQTLKLGLNYQLNREIEDVVTATGTFVGVANDILWLQATVGL